MQQLQSHFYTLRGEDAATHLFRVACGVDSLVLGESQILKQVRTALDTAQQHGSARLLLNELFQRSLRTGKRARSETDIGRGHFLSARQPCSWRVKCLTIWRPATPCC